jgi:alpha-glucosidase
MIISPQIKNDSGRSWWKHGVIYQIYPRSFRDSDGDGIGDLRGIIDSLDYLEWLGADGIWLSPINESPMYDFGYDISDYRAIDPVFGRMDDFDELLRESHRRGIRVIMDLVANHTSHLHHWFRESRSSRENPKRDWYIWRDGRGGRTPNNWISVFGGSAWKLDEQTNQYYLHSFLEEQPDLNWRNAEVKAAVFGEVKFWLDKGVDGFRLDVVNWFVKDHKFRNNPALLGFARFQKHLFDRNRPETHDILRDFRKLVDSYPDRMSVGEVFSLPPGNPHLSAKFLGGGDDELHLSFDFSLMYRFWSARMFYRCVSKWLKAIPEKGWPCHVLSNHDQFRSMSRFGSGADAGKRSKVAAFLLLTLRGTPFIYYGEEIGMRNSSIPRNMICDPLGKRYWPFYAGRDRARTPMAWDASVNAGFSCHRPWLPVHSDYAEINVDTQRRRADSLVNLYRRLIGFRKNHPVMLNGGLKFAAKGKRGVIAYFRTGGDGTVCVLLNFESRERQINLHQKGQWQVGLSTHRSEREHFTRIDLTLYPYEATILVKIGDL